MTRGELKIDGRPMKEMKTGRAGPATRRSVGSVNERYLTDQGARAYAVKYRRNLLRRVSARREASRLEQALQAVDAGGTILDMPCGAGRFTGLVARHASSVVAGDISRPMLMRCRRLSPSTPAIAVDAAALALETHAVRGVVTMRLIHHLRDPAVRRAVLAELARVAERFLVVSFLDASSFKQRWLRLRTRFGRRPPRRAAIERSWLRAEMDALGFEVVAYHAVSRVFSGQTIAACRRRPGPSGAAPISSVE